MTISRRPGAAPEPRPERADSSQPVGAGEPALPLTDADVFALVRGAVEIEPEIALPAGLTGEALQEAWIDAEIGDRKVDRPTSSVFGDVEAVEREVQADVEAQAHTARLSAARERAEQQQAQREHDERVGKRWARVRRTTWIAGTVLVIAVALIVGLLVVDSRVGLLGTPVVHATAVPTVTGGYQVDPSTLTKG